MDENKIIRCIDEIKAVDDRFHFSGGLCNRKDVVMVIPCVNTRFVNHFSPSSVSCFLYEMPRSKFSPRLINSRATIWAAFFAFRKNIFLGDPQKSEPFCGESMTRKCSSAQTRRATKSETNQQKAKHAKQLFHRKCVFSDVRWLFYLHSIQRLFGRIFLHTSGWHNSKVAKLKRKS